MTCAASPTSCIAPDRYERLGETFFARLRQGFIDVAEADPERCVLLAADGDADTVADAVWQAVRSRLGVA